MKIFENISNRSKKIATSIGIVSFLAIMYFALMPVGTVTAQIFSEASGQGINGAFVWLVDYPEYNATTARVGPDDGVYTMKNETGGTGIPYGTYTLRVRAAGYALNTTTVTVDSGAITHNIGLMPGVKYTASGQIYGGQWKTDFRVGNLGNQPTTLDCKFLNASGITKNTSEHVMPSM